MNPSYWARHKPGSCDAFVADQIIRSLDGAPWINRLAGDSEVADLLEAAGAATRKVLAGLYRRIEAFLIETVCVNLPTGHEPISDVAYNRRFGWIGIRGEHEVFLGKLVLENVGRLSVGPRTYFSGPQMIRGAHPVTFGAFCSIAENLYLDSTPDFHPMTVPSTYEFRDEPRDPENQWNMNLAYPEVDNAPTGVSVGHAVWLGRNVRLYHGVTIGNGCVVAEGSLVRGTLEPYGIYAGTPARLKRKRFPDHIIAELEAAAWWNWPAERIRRNRSFFSTDLTKHRGPIAGLMVD